MQNSASRDAQVWIKVLELTPIEPIELQNCSHSHKIIFSSNAETREIM